MTIAENETLTPREAAKVLNVNYFTLLRFIREGRFLARRLAGSNRVLILRTDLEAYLLSSPVIGESDEQSTT
jgi:excisionase family DNA binding protein